MKDVLKKGLVRRFLASLLQPTQRHYSSGSEADELVNRIQILQSAYEMSLPANQPYIVRLDGVAFRNYTVGMQKPFDSRLTRAILLTTRDLLERCSARMAFCQSDEISLLFPPESTPLQIIYAGRVQKIVSVMASLAAARFNWHIGRMSWQDVDDSVRERILSSSATFDARIFSTPSDMMAADGMLDLRWVC